MYPAASLFTACEREPSCQQIRSGEGGEGWREGEGEGEGERGGEGEGKGEGERERERERERGREEKRGRWRGKGRVSESFHTVHHVHHYTNLCTRTPAQALASKPEGSF